MKATIVVVGVMVVTGVLYWLSDREHTGDVCAEGVVVSAWNTEEPPAPATRVRFDDDTIIRFPLDERLRDELQAHAGQFVTVLCSDHRYFVAR